MLPLWSRCALAVIGFAATSLVLLWLMSGWFQINASDKGVVQRFGRFTEVRNEGWGWAFPWPIETVTKVNVSQVNSVEYRSRMLTADVNLVEIRSAIQYQNTDPVKVLFQVRDVEATLREVSESAIREVVGQASLDDVLGAARQRITDQTKERIQRTLDGYGTQSLGSPRLIAVSGANFRVLDDPDGATATLRYYRKLATPTPAAANAILTSYPDLYLHGCLIECATFEQDAQAAAGYLALYNASVQGLNARTQRITASSVPVMRLRAGMTP